MMYLMKGEYDMTREENIRAILECNFAGYKDEIIDNTVKRICELEQEPKISLQGKEVLDEIADIMRDGGFPEDLEYELYKYMEKRGYTI